MASAGNKGVIAVDSRGYAVYRGAACGGRRHRRWAAGLLVLTLACGPAAAEGPLDDPMRPPTAHPEEKAPDPGERIERLELTSTVVGPDRRVAVIDGRRLGVGDRIGGARIIAINPSSVRLVAAGRSYVLRLLRKTIKRPASEGSED